MSTSDRKRGAAFVALRKREALQRRSGVAAAAAAAVLQARDASEQDQAVVLNMVARILNSTPQVLFWKNREGVYLGCNEAFVRLVGFQTPAEVIGKTDACMPWSREETESLRAEDLQVMQRNQPSNHIVQAIHQAGGARRWFDTTKVPLLDESGQVYGVLGVAEDITERKQLELSLEQSLSLLRATLESTADGILVVDLKGQIVNFNECFAEMWGIPTDLLPNRRPGFILEDKSDRPALEHALTKVKDSTAFMAKVDSLYAHPEASSFDVVELKDGRVFERYSQPQWIEGKAIGRVWSFSDVTKRAQAQAALQRQLAFDELVTRSLARFASASGPQIDAGLQLTLEEVGTFMGVDRTFIALLSADGHRWSWSYCWCAPGVGPGASHYQDRPIEAAAWAASKLLAGEVVRLNSLHDLPPELAEVRRQYTDQGIRAALTVPLRADGKQVVGCIGLHSLRGETTWREEDLKRLRMVGDAVANTLKRQRTEESLRLSEEKFRALNVDLEERVQARTTELAAANQELETFAYAVSHDLRAPLRSVAGFSQILMEMGAKEVSEQAHSYLRKIQTSAQQMNLLIVALLQLSQASRGEMHRSTVDLAEIAREVWEELRQTHRSGAPYFIVASPVVAEGDPTLLRAALQNLLSNAWKFSLRNPQGRVEFGVNSTQKDPVYFVRDNGVGFDMAGADKLFHPFVRLHRQDEFPGTGVGLTTVQRIIRRHGGRIWGESEPGSGATFYFTLGAEA